MKHLLLALAACGGTPSTSTTTSEPPVEGTPPTTSSSSDAPEISRSPGVDGGIVILWPRMKDPALAPIAAQIQQRLADIATRALPGRPVDIRPSPERVCTRSGCKAIAIGAGLLQNGDEACAVIAFVSQPGPSDQIIVPWVGDMQLKAPVAAFREPPESQVQVKDYARCTTIVDGLAAREKDVEAAIKLAAGI